MTELTVEAKTEKLESVIEFIKKLFTDKPHDYNALMSICIAVEEIFVNIARYAYPNSTGFAEIQVEFKNSCEVRITFIDSGIPYNPLEHEDPDITLPTQQRSIGGLGIFIVKKSMDDVEYEYAQGKNHLTLVKQFYNQKEL